MHSACFAEINLNNRSYEDIKFIPGWDGIHKLTNHDLAIFFDTEKVKTVREYRVTSVLEVLPMFIEIGDETVILVLVYRKPGALGSFIQDLIGILLEVPTEYRTFVIK